MVWRQPRQARQMRAGHSSQSWTPPGDPILGEDSTTSLRQGSSPVLLSRRGAILTLEHSLTPPPQTWKRFESSEVEGTCCVSSLPLSPGFSARPGVRGGDPDGLSCRDICSPVEFRSGCPSRLPPVWTWRSWRVRTTL